MKTHIIHMDASADAIPPVAAQIARYCERSGMDKQSCFEVQVVIAEVLNNIVEHALPQTHHDDKIEINFGQTEDFVVITTIDEGITVAEVPPFKFPDSQKEKGRGWPIIFNWMDSIEYFSDRGCNYFTLKKALD